MSTNAQDIFDIAMGLMGELGETGETDTRSTEEYKNRALFILNALRGECFAASDTFRSAFADGGARPVCPVIADFTTSIGIDDGVAQTVMPYGLAAQLLLDENASSASFFQQRYEELLKSCARSIPAGFESIWDGYGGVGCGGFGRW